MKKILKSKNARKTLRTYNNKLSTLDKVSKNGKIFSVTFIKKNGDERVMSCRKGVKKYLSGGSNTVSHLKQYVTVFDCNAKGYRNVNINTLKSIKGAGKVYNF